MWQHLCRELVGHIDIVERHIADVINLETVGERVTGIDVEIAVVIIIDRLGLQQGKLRNAFQFHNRRVIACEVGIIGCIADGSIAVTGCHEGLIVVVALIDVGLLDDVAGFQDG